MLATEREWCEAYTSYRNGITAERFKGRFALAAYTTAWHSTCPNGSAAVWTAKLWHVVEAWRKAML